ncbi:MAG: hypothetical protein C0401_10375 [Anaerolinea sp.]|nr:hypothetical protein [Anaerolinea sp.]
MKTNEPSQPEPSPTSEFSMQGEQKVDLSFKTQSKVGIAISMAPGSEVEVRIQRLDSDGNEIAVETTSYSNPGLPDNSPAASPKKIFKSFKRMRLTTPSWQMWLIAAALVVYLVSRFIGLSSYPIYFFTDEAVQTVLAADLVRDGFHSYTKELLPAFLVNGGQFNLGTSVYAQILPWLMFGKSIWVTRGTSVLITLLAALAVGLTMKNIVKSRYAFAAILLLSITPAWFLHSRTAFETAMAVSFYAAFLYTYLKYREGSPRHLIAAVVFGALGFYSYSPAQMVMAVTALGLLISDWRVHLKNWKMILIGAGVAALLAIPYIRFLILHPDENTRHLQILNSYWIQSIPFIKKLGIYFSEYLKLLNPFYWFIPNQIDLERHMMKNYGHLLRWSLPFFLLGLGIAIRKIKMPQNRVFLIALLAAPSGAALAGAGITRALFLVIPAVILTTIGLDQILTWLEKWKTPRAILIAIIFLGLSTFNGFMVQDALVNGPLWYKNYGLAGQQYGANQVFSEIKQMVRANPHQKIFLSPSWSNGTDVLARFFFDDPLPFEMGSLDGFLYEKREISEDQVFILIPEEMELARTSGKFKNIQELDILPYPNGDPGFYIVTLQYADNIDEILLIEHNVRQQLLKTELTNVDGDQLIVQYPQLDMGNIEALFDGNYNTLARTFEANPMKLMITLENSITINQVAIRIGGTASTLEVQIVPADGSTPVTLQKIVTESNDFRDILFGLEKPLDVTEIRISILNTHDVEPAHVHVWEVSIK